MAFQFPSDLEVLFFLHHQPEVPIWTHDSDDNDSQRNQTAPRANPRSTGLTLEQNGLLTTPWILGRLVPCGVRQNRVPSPDPQSWGTSAQRRGIRLHLSRVGRVSPSSPRFLFYTPESFPNDDSTTRENLCLSVGVKTRTNHPLAQAEPQSTGVVALAGVAGKRCVGDKTCFESRRLLPSASATARHNGRECAASHRHEGIGALDREEHSRDRSAAGNQAGRELPLHAP